MPLTVFVPYELAETLANPIVWVCVVAFTLLIMAASR